MDQCKSTQTTVGIDCEEKRRVPATRILSSTSVELRQEVKALSEQYECIKGKADSVMAEDQ